MPSDVMAMKRAGDVPALIEALANENFQARVIAAAALGEVGDGQAVEPLCRALDDPDRGVVHNGGT